MTTGVSPGCSSAKTRHAASIFSGTAIDWRASSSVIVPRFSARKKNLALFAASLGDGFPTSKRAPVVAALIFFRGGHYHGVSVGPSSHRFAPAGGLTFGDTRQRFGFGIKKFLVKLQLLNFQFAAFGCFAAAALPSLPQHVVQLRA